MNSSCLTVLLTAFALALPLRAATPASPSPHPGAPATPASRLVPPPRLTPATRAASTLAAATPPPTSSSSSATSSSSSDFRVTTAFPKYVTADIEFRDPSGAKWPNFFYGRPANDTGVIRPDAAKPQAAFALLCDKMAQPSGDQTRKVLGELCTPGQPPAVSLDIQSMGPLQVPAASAKGTPGSSTATLQGVLDIGGRKVPVKMETTFRHHDGGGAEKNTAMMLDGHADLKASDLGLKALPAAALITVRFGLTAYPESAASVKPPKK